MELGIVLGQTDPGLGDLATQLAGVLQVQVGFHVPRHRLLVCCSLITG